MSNQLWCKVCNQSVDVVVSRAVAAAAASLAGALAMGVPRLLGRKRSGLLSTIFQGLAVAGAGYLATHYLAPKLQQTVCGRCGTAAVAQPSAA